MSHNEYSEIREQARRCYNSVAPEYNSYYSDAVAIHEAYNPDLFNVLSKHSNILEVGPGIGDQTTHLIGAGHNVICVDIAEALLFELKKQLPDVVALHIDFFEANFLQETFHCVVAMLVYHLLPAETASLFLAKIWELLKPKGIILISTNTDEFNHEGYIAKSEMKPAPRRYKRYLTPQSFQKEVEEAGFSLLGTYQRDTFVVEGTGFTTLLAQKNT
jgi:2-polyprenyl-3-methyl-5-hydroxy-6-metoxy-1,4-benzoquinol methylase